MEWNSSVTAAKVCDHRFTLKFKGECDVMRGGGLSPLQLVY